MDTKKTHAPEPAVSAFSAPFSENTSPLRDESSRQKEGAQRERLAVYFLSLPSGAPDCLTGKPRDDYRRAARELSSLELSAALQFAGRSRPLRCGDAAALFRAVAGEAVRRLADRGIELAAGLPDGPAIAVMEPRLTVFTLLRLLRDAAAAPREGRVLFQLRVCPEQLLFTVTGGPGFLTPPTAALMRETARLHKGGAVSALDSAAFSLGRNAGPSVGFFDPPSSETLRAPLSPVALELC